MVGVLALGRGGDGGLALNLAPPVMQGIVQQLILDRRVGSDEVPTGWFIWAGGNREEDRASDVYLTDGYGSFPSTVPLGEVVRML